MKSPRIWHQTTPLAQIAQLASVQRLKQTGKSSSHHAQTPTNTTASLKVQGLPKANIPCFDTVSTTYMQIQPFAEYENKIDVLLPSKCEAEQLCVRAPFHSDLRQSDCSFVQARNIYYATNGNAVY